MQKLTINLKFVLFNLVCFGLVGLNTNLNACNTEQICIPPFNEVSSPVTLCPDFCNLEPGTFVIEEENVFSTFNCTVYVDGDCVEYLPLPAFYNTMDSVVIIACDSINGICDTASFSIIVGCLPPVASLDNFVIDGNDPIQLDVLANDFTECEIPIKIGAIMPIELTIGTLSVTEDSTALIFKAAAGFNGTSSFDYIVKNACNEVYPSLYGDYNNATDQGTISIEVQNNDYTNDCASDESEIIIEVMTDQYPTEIAWSLSTNEVVLAQVPFGTYNINATLFTDTICVPQNTCLELTFDDQSGDGICCGFGTGYFNVYLDGNLVLEGDGNYQSGTTVDVACNPGDACSSPIPLESFGIQTAPMQNTWYIFTPDTSGQFPINTCNMGNDCNTAIWVYDYCVGLDWDNNPQGAIYYAETGCQDSETDALMNANLVAGQSYYIRIGSEDNSCNETIDWQINYNGPASGCIDSTACNFDSYATVMDIGSCIYPGDPNCPDGPDLVVLEDVLQNSFFIELKDNDEDCFIEENCVSGYGQRQLLRFTTQIENIGEQDFYIGAFPDSPEDNEETDQWEWDPCHGHWHYEGYAEYVLYDENQQPLPTSFKNGFCLQDSDCSFGGGTPKYGCVDQGLSAHCGDIYTSDLPCQWVDITDIPDANYTLVVRVNWDQSPDAIGRVEKNFTNNWAQACIQIYTDVNGNRSVGVLADCNPYVDCTGQIYGEAVLDCMGDCEGTTLQGDINSDQDLSNEDLTTYINNILDGSVETMTGPCLDLNADEQINVTDAVLLLGCIIQDGEAIGGVDYCEFPYNVTNPLDTVSLRLGNVNIDEKYLEVEMSNPNGEVMAFQFSIDGIGIESLEPIDNVFDGTNFTFDHGTNEIIGIAADMESLIKREDYYPILRVYYGGEQTADSEACIGKITAIVNELREKTITKYEETCQMLMPTGMEQLTLPNLQVSPNPFSESTTFQFGENITGTLELNNIKGQVLKTIKLENQNTLTLKRNELVSGIYMYQIKGTNFIKSGKLIVE